MHSPVSPCQTLSLHSQWAHLPDDSFHNRMVLSALPLTTCTPRRRHRTTIALFRASRTLCSSTCRQSTGAVCSWSTPTHWPFAVSQIRIEASLEPERTGSATTGEPTSELNQPETTISLSASCWMQFTLPMCPSKCITHCPLRISHICRRFGT